MNRYLIALCLAAFFSSSNCLAQFRVDNSDGSSVTIGPGGINVTSPTRGTNLNVTPGGISGVTGTQGRATRLNVVPANVRTTGRVVRPSGQSSSTTVRTAPAYTAVSGDNSLQVQVEQIELAVTGSPQKNLPLIARVEKLEVDNLGQKGSGPLKVRIETLAKALGVNLKATAQPPAATGSQTIVRSSRNDVTGGETANIHTTGGGDSSVHITDGKDSVNISGTSVTDQYGNVSDVSITPNGISVNSRGHGPQSRSRVQVESTRNGDSNFVVIENNNQNLSYTLADGEMVINSNNCDIKLHGHCRSLTVNGNNNHVSAERIAAIVTNGNGNNVTWSASDNPTIVDNGNGNSVHRK